MIMWKAIKEILLKKACLHEWKLVKEDRFGSHFHYIYICLKCGEIKVIEVKQINGERAIFPTKETLIKSYNYER